MTEGYLEEQAQKLCDGLDTLVTPEFERAVKTCPREQRQKTASIPQLRHNLT